MTHILAWFALVILFTVTSIKGVPTVALDKFKCPFGTGVYGDKILIGTEAKCKCDVIGDGVAVWYSQDNTSSVEQQTHDSNGSSVLDLTYVHSESSQTYTCKKNATLNATGDPVTYSPQFRCSYNIAERGKATHFQCPVVNSVKSITWHLVYRVDPVNISICNLGNNTCDDLMPDLYKAFVSGSGSDQVTGLNVSSARTNETMFAYWTDDGARSNISELEVYAWPQPPYCTQTLKNTTINIMCNAESVYPNAQATIHRRRTEFVDGDVYTNPTTCELAQRTEDTYFVMCTFEIPANKMIIPDSHIYVEMKATVTRVSEINQTAAISKDVVTNSIWPTVSLSDCPKGSDVKDGKILVGTDATCKCQATRSDVSDGIARWFTSKGEVVGDERDSYSILPLHYSPSQTNETYNCMAITPFSRAVNEKRYTTNYRSSTPPVATNGLQNLIVILAAICFGINSRMG